jgi:hypothetical protein
MAQRVSVGPDHPVAAIAAAAVAVAGGAIGFAQHAVMTIGIGMGIGGGVWV